MITPNEVHGLPAGSVVVASEWAAVRLPTEPRRYRFWQVTGKVARLSDAELSSLVARTQEGGDPLVTIIRNGSIVPGLPPEDLEKIRDELEGVVDEMVTSRTYGMPVTAARNVEATLRSKFERQYPRLARLLR